MTDRLSYIAEATRDLRKALKITTRNNAPNLASHISRTLEKIQESVYYALDFDTIKAAHERAPMKLGDALNIPHESVTMAVDLSELGSDPIPIVVTVSRAILPELENLMEEYGIGDNRLLVTASVLSYANVWVPIYATAVVNAVVVNTDGNEPAAPQREAGVVSAFFQAAKESNTVEFAKAGGHAAVEARTKILRCASWFVVLFCAALRAEGTAERVIQTASPRNSARILAGQLPIWETKTLTITLPSERVVSEYKGGTHASPRQHLRRGHYRHCKKSGKVVWVNQCTVGSLANGYIHKDYRVNAVSAPYQEMAT